MTHICTSAPMHNAQHASWKAQLQSELTARGFSRRMSRRWCHSRIVNYFGFELFPSALAALTDTFTTTLCPRWAPRLSRICPTCTPCKSWHISVNTVFFTPWWLTHLIMLLYLFQRVLFNLFSLMLWCSWLWSYNVLPYVFQDAPRGQHDAGLPHPYVD